MRGEESERRYLRGRRRVLEQLLRRRLLLQQRLHFELRRVQRDR